MKQQKKLSMKFIVYFYYHYGDDAGMTFIKYPLLLIRMYQI